MNIIVCVKQVIDPEAPPSSFKINPATNSAEMQGAPPVIDPYGEYALEAALQIKDKEDSKITVISLGNNLLREVVKKSLAMGANELILLEDEAYTGGDNYSTAYALAMAIKKVGEYDLILCGREASDTNSGQTGAGIAEILGIPCVTLAKKIEIAGGKARIERATSNGYDVIEAGLPLMITASNEIGEARYPTIKGIMAAKKVEPIVWKPADIEAEASKLGATGQMSSVQKLYQPVHEGKCEYVEGDSPEESGANLAVKLREAKIL
jgi:electron transfer flavoprotein beta subunit